MKMNKLLFTLNRDYNDSIILVANNHKDLEDYLVLNYDFYNVTVKDDYVSIVARKGDCKEIGKINWIKQVGNE